MSYERRSSALTLQSYATPNTATAMIATIVAMGPRSKFWNQDVAVMRALDGMKGC